MDLCLSHDINFTIAIAPQRFAKKWKHTKTTWSHLLERLSKPTVTGETVAEYKTMKKSDRDNRKDIGGFVCGYLKNGQRLKQNVFADVGVMVLTVMNASRALSVKSY